MKTLIRFAIVPALCVAGVAVFLYAQDAPAGRTSGKVLLLRTGHAMEGDIERVREQFCVRRGKSEVWIAADRAVRLCADWDDAYEFAQSLVKTDDVNGRMQLARWCHLHRMNDRALEQAQRALELQPNSPEAKQLVAQLERMLKDPRPAPTPIALPAPAAKTHEPPPVVDVSFETVVAFTTKVQPILMNTCASCHATGHGGKFQLERITESSKKASTQRNLASVLDYIDLERPAISPLLVRAVTAHGGGLAPAIKDRNAVPLQAIHHWIEQTIAKNPQLKDYQAARNPAAAKSSGDSNFAVAGKQTMSPVSIPALPGAGLPADDAPKRVAAPKTAAPREPADMYDPAHFNRWAHPRRQ